MDECVILSMPPTLIDGRPDYFSKTARSRPGHREAARRRLGAGALAVLARRLPDDRPERPAERAEAREADVEGHVGHAPIGLAQQEHRALDAAALEVAVRRLAEGRAEGADEMRLRHVRELRERRDVERLRVAAIHGVARAEHAPVALLDGAAHWLPRAPIGQTRLTGRIR